MQNSVRGLIAATLLAGTAFVATPALADDAPAAAPTPEIKITGSVDLTTDYRFRGVSQSSGDAAIQGGLTVTDKSGVYASFWSSSTDFRVVGGQDVYGSQELDLIGGWTGNLSKNLTLDAGLLYYAYPNGHVGNAEFFEPYGSLATQMGPAHLKVGFNYAWKQKALLNFTGTAKKDDLYVYGNVDFAIPKTPLTLSGHIGYADGALAPGYYLSDDDTGWDWSVSASATVYGPLSLSVAYIGTSGVSLNKYTDDTVVGTLTASF